MTKQEAAKTLYKMKASSPEEQEAIEVALLTLSDPAERCNHCVWKPYFFDEIW